jgi:hypothetical protein
VFSKGIAFSQNAISGAVKELKEPTPKQLVQIARMKKLFVKWSLFLHVVATTGPKSR